MEDVVLHYQPGSAAGLSSLLETTEKLLECFPCRTPPVFSPWFPPAADRHLPIRPAKPAPIITSAGDLFSQSNAHAAARGKRPHGGPRAETPTTPPEDPQSVCILETPTHLLPAPLCNKLPTASAEEHRDKDGCPVTDSPARGSWSVFPQRGVLLQSSQSLSKHFHHMVSTHRLHLRQRVKWVISRHNCGGAGGVEKAWRALSRSVRTSGLPTCNANIQREQAEIWVFCDVVHAEQVGRVLKDELQLSGRINLSVRTLGNICSM